LASLVASDGTCRFLAASEAKDLMVDQLWWLESLLILQHRRVECTAATPCHRGEAAAMLHLLVSHRRAQIHQHPVLATRPSSPLMPTDNDRNLCRAHQLFLRRLHSQLRQTSLQRPPAKQPRHWHESEAMHRRHSVASTRRLRRTQRHSCHHHQEVAIARQNDQLLAHHRLLLAVHCWISSSNHRAVIAMVGSRTSCRRSGFRGPHCRVHNRRINLCRMTADMMLLNDRQSPLPFLPQLRSSLEADPSRRQNTRPPKARRPGLQFKHRRKRRGGFLVTTRFALRFHQLSPSTQQPSQTLIWLATIFPKTSCNSQKRRKSDTDGASRAPRTHRAHQAQAPRTRLAQCPPKIRQHHDLPSAAAAPNHVGVFKNRSHFRHKYNPLIPALVHRSVALQCRQRSRSTRSSPTLSVRRKGARCRGFVANSRMAKKESLRNGRGVRREIVGAGRILVCTMSLCRRGARVSSSSG